MDGSDTTYVVNVFYIYSATYPTKIQEPMDVVQRAIAESINGTDDGDYFEWDEEWVIALKKKVKEAYPKHKDTPATLAILDDIMRRDPSGQYEFNCY
jgi:hypothetical protein